MVLAPLCLLLVLWLWLFQAEGAFKGGPSGKALGADFAMFVGAAQVLERGGDPYNHGVLLRAEQGFMQRQGLAMTNRKAVVRVGNPPLFLWALQPLTSLPFQPVAWVWMLALYALSGLGFAAVLAWLGWRHFAVPTLLFLAFPQTILGMYYGNVIDLVLAAVGCSLWLAKRHPLLAGALLSLAWLKPPVALPVVVLIVLFHAPRRGPLLAGFTSATAGLLGLTLAAAGTHSLMLWVQGLMDYSRDMAIQPDVASLSGLYVRWAPPALRLGLEAASLALAVGLTARQWWQSRNHLPASPLAVAWLWCVWLVATPYAHFFDDMLLAVPVLAFIGVDGARVGKLLPASAIYLAFFSLLVINPIPIGVYLLPLPAVVLGILLYRGRGQEARTQSASDVLTTAPPRFGHGIATSTN